MNEVLNKILTILYNFSPNEYLLLGILSISLPLLILILSLIFPKRFTKEIVIASLFTLLSPIFYTLILIFILILQNQTYTFDIVFMFSYLIICIWIGYIYGISTDKMSKYLLFSLSILLLNVILIFTSLISIPTSIAFILSYLITVLILSLRLRKYYEKM